MGHLSMNLPVQVRKNKFVEIVPINVGCLGACTYCKTKHARGHLGSYPVASLVLLQSFINSIVYFTAALLVVRDRYFARLYLLIWVILIWTCWKQFVSVLGADFLVVYFELGL